jgi:hypothetical protein
MRAIIDAGDLYRALRIARKGQKGNRMPVLSNVLLEVREGRFSVSCYDLETWTERTLRAMGAVDGATTVPAKLLRDLAQVWKDAGPMLLETLVQEPLPFSTAEDGYQASLRPGGNVGHLEIRPAEHSLLIKVTRSNFTAHLVAIDAEQFPPKPVVLENAA